MKNKSYSVFLTILFSSTLFTAAAQRVETLQENSAIRLLLKKYEQALNNHDPKALAATYTLDATCINWFGAYYAGQPDIEAHYCTTHTTYFEASHYYTRAVEDIQYLKPDVAVAHVRTGLTNDRINESEWGVANPGGAECQVGERR